MVKLAILLAILWLAAFIFLAMGGVRVPQKWSNCPDPPNCPALRAGPD